MARQSIQYTLSVVALNGVNDSHTIKAYKEDIRLFVDYCKDQGIKSPEAAKNSAKDLLQAYERTLEDKGYSPSTIHRRLAAPCKGLSVPMRDIDKPKRTAGSITRSREDVVNTQGAREAADPRFDRVVTLQSALGIRRAELAKLKGKDLCKDESGQLCVKVDRGKGGKEQLQRILPADQDAVIEIFKGIPANGKVFSDKEMTNKIDLHGIRRDQAQIAYKYYADRFAKDPNYRREAKIDLLARYQKYNRGDPAKWLKSVVNDTPYILRGDNRQIAIKKGKPITYDRLALMMVSVFHLSHWRLDVTVTNYMI